MMQYLPTGRRTRTPVSRPSCDANHNSRATSLSHLPCWRLGHRSMPTIISPVGEKLTCKLLCVLVHLVDPEANFVDAFHFARGPPPLHQTDHRAAHSLWVLSVG